MIDDILKKFILNGCYSEVKRYEKYKETSHLEFEEYASGQWTYVVEMMILTVKSLVLSIDKSGIIVDYNRFNEELKLWIYYRHGKNKSIIDAINSNNDESYWTDIDDSIYSRIVPIVAANESWDVIKYEIINNVLFTTGNTWVLLESIMLSKLLYLLLERNNRTSDEILSVLKEEIIGLSQKYFILEHQDFFRISIGKYNGNYSIDFERNRIDIINLLNGIHKEDKYQILDTCLDIVIRNTDLNGNENFFVNGLNALRHSIEENKEIKDKEFIESLCSYLIKLRKGRIAPESLTIDNYNMLNIFKYSEGDGFVHPLLNKCKVINRKEINGILVIYIRSKSGIYRFMKRKK